MVAACTARRRLERPRTCGGDDGGGYSGGCRIEAK